MRRITSLYLGGPDAVLLGAADLLQRKRSLCESAGFVPVVSTDSILVETQPSEAMAREMYADRVSRMRLADAAIINLSPWRGPSCDPAAAFEVGFLAALNKPVFGYMNVATEEEADLGARIAEQFGVSVDASGRLTDGYGAEIEDFGLPEAVMVWAEVRRLYVVVTPDTFGDLSGFELCLEAVQLYAS